MEQALIKALIFVVTMIFVLLMVSVVTIPIRQAIQDSFERKKRIEKKFTKKKGEF